jgi:hypothetical protein
MYVIDAFCPLLFFLQILVLLTILTCFYSLPVECKWYRKGKGKGKRVRRGQQ